MKDKTIESEKRNMFGIIKEAVFGSLANFLKTLGNTEIDEEQEEVSPAAKAEVSKIERTTLDNTDVVEVEAGGKTPDFGGLDSYKRDVNVNEAVKAHEEKLKQQEQKNKEPESIERGNS